MQTEVFKPSKIARKTAQIEKYGNLNVSKQAGYCTLSINYNNYY